MAPPSAGVPHYRFMREESPWGRPHAIVSSAIVAVGAGLGIVGWVGLSGENTFREQSNWLVLAVFAAVLISIGMSVWLLFGLREVRRGEREILAEIRRRRADRARERDRGDRERFVGTGTLVTAPQLTRFHRADCRLVRAKQFETVSRADARARGLQECGVCRP
jgi:hypothetical protein